MQADTVNLEETAFSDIDEMLEQRENPANIVWKDQLWFADEHFAQCHALVVDGDRGELTLVRLFKNGDGPLRYNEDFRKSFVDVKGEIDQMDFPHGGNADPDSDMVELELAFREEVGGDVVFLWRFDNIDTASFVARVARVGRDEAVACGTATRAPDGAIAAKVDFDAPMDELLPTTRHSARR